MDIINLVFALLVQFRLKIVFHHKLADFFSENDKFFNLLLLIDINPDLALKLIYELIRRLT